jgi:hypothetical protein
MYMKNSILLALSVSLGIVASLQAADQTYDWTKGLPGYSGTIVLDSSSSAGGSLADVVSISVTTPGGSDTLTQANIADVYINNPYGPFTWNASQITGMWIAWYTTSDHSMNAPAGGVGQNYQPSIPGHNFVFDPNDNFIDFVGLGNKDLTGAWRAASVPDAGSTSLLLGLALTGLGACRRFGRGK